MASLFAVVFNPTISAFNWLLFWKTRELEKLDQPMEEEQPWHGLPEADLSLEQEQAAQEAEAWRREHPQE